MKGKATTDSFNERYEENLVRAETYKQAYELTERDHENEFGDRKYSSYKSFKVNRSRIKNR